MAFYIIYGTKLVKYLTYIEAVYKLSYLFLGRGQVMSVNDS